MVLKISSAALHNILARAAESPDAEVCGLLLGEEMQVTQTVACANVAASPADSFEIDPAALIAAHRSARTGGAAVIGHYHSHPSGGPEPSLRDRALAMGDGAIWLIVAQGRFTAWVSRSAGRLSAIDVMADGGGCVMAPASPEGRAEALLNVSKALD